jgi:eukaryotic-like serine/threonine-protein kinase
MGLMAKHLLETPPPISRLRSDLRPEYDDVLLRALEKDPHRRWPTAEAFRVALQTVHQHADEPRRLLIVDDDDDWRSILKSALRSQFPAVEVEVASDGAEAMNALERTAYCAVLLDLELPAVDGIELTRRLRESSGVAAKTPIIVMTAAGGPGEWRRLSRLGADAFLVKPVNPEDVALLIRRTIRSRAERGDAPPISRALRGAARCA